MSDLEEMYDVNLFFQIVEGIAGIKFLGEDFHERTGVCIRKYEGLTGKLVILDVTEEEITVAIAKFTLIQLGLEHLIEPIFSKSNTSS